MDIEIDGICIKPFTEHYTTYGSGNTELIYFQQNERYRIDIDVVTRARVMGEHVVNKEKITKNSLPDELMQKVESLFADVEKYLLSLDE